MDEDSLPKKECGENDEKLESIVEPPDKMMMSKLATHIRLQHEREEKDRELCAARAKAREIAVDECAGYERDLNGIEANLRMIDRRIHQLGFMKSKIFMELKEVVAKEKVERRRQYL